MGTDNEGQRAGLPKELRLAERVARLMDGQFKVPGTGFRFGLDPIIGLIPGAGDAVSFLISGTVLVSLIRGGIPRSLALRMLLNLLLDLVIGGIPVIGDVWDFFHKANRKNLDLAKEYYAGQSGK